MKKPNVVRGADSASSDAQSMSLFATAPVPDKFAAVSFARSAALPSSARSVVVTGEDEAISFYTGVLRVPVQVPTEREHYAFLHADEMAEPERYSLGDIAADWQRDGIAVFCSHGGYFSGAIFRQDGQAVLHKGFRRYVVRKGQGNRQSKHANKNASRKCRSAGGRLRGFNEVKHAQQTAELLAAWEEELQRVAVIWLATPGANRKTFEEELPAAVRRKVRSVPLTVRRPSLAECRRIAMELATVQLGPREEDKNNDDDDDDEEMPERYSDEWEDESSEEEEEEDASE